MAFDMYAAGLRESIDEQDATLFALAAEAPGDFPQLNALWARFYGDVKLDSDQAGALVHELLMLHARFGAQAGHRFAALVLRLAQFFSAAHRAGAVVRCSGD